MKNLDNQIIVSIKCLVYNHAPYIRQCLDGFVMQKTNFRFEAIVHDDASTDGTQDIIREYAERYPDIIRPIYETENQYSKRDGSLRRIMNEAVSPDTKYIALCEGDDYWTDPLKLQKQVSFLDNHPDYVICTHDFFYFDQYKMGFKEGTPYSYIFAKPNNKMFFDYSLDLYFEGWWTHPLSCMYRNGQYLKDIPYIQYKKFRDDILFYYILKEGKGALLSDNMGVYRIHGSGVWSKLSYIEQKETSMNNAYDIYLVEHDRNAFKKITRIQYEVLLYLKKEKLISDYFKKLRKYLKMDPYPFFLKLMWSITKLDLSVIYNKIKSFCV